MFAVVVAVVQDVVCHGMHVTMMVMAVGLVVQSSCCCGSHHWVCPAGAGHAQ
jgi:hypothetical protein